MLETFVFANLHKIIQFYAHSHKIFSPPQFANTSPAGCFVCGPEKRLMARFFRKFRPLIFCMSHFLYNFAT